MLVTSGITAQHGCIFDGGLKLGLLFAQAMHPGAAAGSAVRPCAARMSSIRFSTAAALAASHFLPAL